jgi:formyl-CoA transferase
LIERLNAAGVPCGPINTIDKVFADPQVRHLKVAQAVGGGKGKGKAKALILLAQPVSLSRTPSRLVRRPPGQGEHTGTVLKEFGFSKREIAALRQAKAI